MTLAYLFLFLSPFFNWQFVVVEKLEVKVCDGLHVSLKSSKMYVCMYCQNPAIENIRRGSAVDLDFKVVDV